MQDEIKDYQKAGVDENQAGGMLILNRWWRVNPTPNLLDRATKLSRQIGIENLPYFLLFIDESGLAQEVKDNWLKDDFFEQYGIFHQTSLPLSDFLVRSLMQERLPPMEVRANAARFATLLSPLNMEAWWFLASFKARGAELSWGQCNYVEEGTAKAEEFLAKYPNADPAFQEQLRKGIERLKTSHYLSKEFSKALQKIAEQSSPPKG